MRLLFLSSLYPNSRQPFQAQYNRSLVSALGRLGADVDVVAPVPHCPIVDRWLRQRLSVPTEEQTDGAGISHPRFFYTPGFLVQYHYRFYRWAVRRMMLERIATRAIDHVMLGFTYPDAAAMAPVCLAAAVPYSVLVLGSDFRVRVRQPGFRELVLRTLQQAPVIFCPGQALKRDLAATGLDAGKIVAFSNGVNSGIFFPPEAKVAQPGPKVVLFVGNLLPVKGLDRLLAAWRTVLDATATTPPPQLRLVGDGPLRAVLEREAQAPALQESVRFLGPLPQVAVAEQMRLAHCLCLPSRSEGMPNVVLEALACGLPVVATAVGETPFLIDSSVNGFLVTGVNEATVVRNLASNLGVALGRRWDPQHVIAASPMSSWDESAKTVLKAVSATAAR